MQTERKFGLALLLGLAVFGVGRAWAADQSAAAAKGKNVVLWISVDGNRGDYVDRGVTPFLKSLMEHGDYTKQLTPMFPSLTFPSHVCEATGVKPGVHGIVSNKWFDTSIGQEYNMPGDPKLLEAEPIWITATKQGIRTAVLDWPLAQAEEQLAAGSAKAAYYNEKFDPDLTDEQRLEKLVDIYRNDFQKMPDQPLQLLMGYVHDIDTAGHKFGPDAEQTTHAAHNDDAVLAKIVGEVADIFKQNMHPENGDKLYVLITTDHGMDNVTTLVNLHNLMGGADVPESVKGETSGSLGNIYLNNVPGAEREAAKKTILENLKKNSFLKAWAREDLPADWMYGNPTRTGDIVVSLAAGYDFSSHEDIDSPTPAASVPNALKGMHGYDPAEDGKMQGFAVLIRWGADGPAADAASKDLGPIDTLQIHPTVARLLGIQPADDAKGKPLAPLP